MIFEPDLQTLLPDLTNTSDENTKQGMKVRY
jgi:hypothetical protein